MLYVIELTTRARITVDAVDKKDAEIMAQTYAEDFNRRHHHGEKTFGAVLGTPDPNIEAAQRQIECQEGAMKKLEMGGVIHSMNRQETLIVTLKHENGTYFDVAVGDLPIDQEDIAASIGKRINFKFEGEIQEHPCTRHKHHPKDGPCTRESDIFVGPGR